jgi:hypothetical protein
MMLAVALPAAITTVVIVGFTALEIAGRTPLALHPANMAEAAAMGNAAETVRRLSFGESPYRVEHVRGDILQSDPLRVTPLEAAVYSKKLELIRLLDSRGLLFGDEVRAPLVCLAADISAGDIGEYLQRDHAVECEPGAALGRIRARSKKEEVP